MNNSISSSISISFSNLSILVKYVLLKYHLHQTNDLKLPTSLDKDCNFLIRYIDATKYKNEFLMLNSFEQKLSLLSVAFQEWQDVSKTEEHKSVQLFPITNISEKCLQ